MVRMVGRRVGGVRLMDGLVGWMEVDGLMGLGWWGGEVWLVG